MERLPHVADDDRMQQVDARQRRTRPARVDATVREAEHRPRAERDGHRLCEIEELWAGSQPREWNEEHIDRKSTRLNSSHSQISYAVFCLKKKKKKHK